MKGAAIFLLIFAITLMVTLSYPSLPPGQMIYEVVGGVDVDYFILGISVTTLVPAVFNAVIYGFNVWLIYTLMRRATRKDPHKQIIQQTVSVQSQVKESPRRLTKQRDDKPIGVSLTSIEGVGSIFAEKLAAMGITTTTNLLEAGKTRTGRGALAEKAGISPRLILEWVNLSDLMRVKGVSEQYSDLLKQAGVNTVAELGQRNPENLQKKLQEINEDQKLVKRLPSVSTVAEWISRAKQLPRNVTY
jgi:predicted flap endonuclease-1-like 5' DNA nuclease